MSRLHPTGDRVPLVCPQAMSLRSRASPTAPGTGQGTHMAAYSGHGGQEGHRNIRDTGYRADLGTQEDGGQDKGNTGDRGEWGTLGNTADMALQGDGEHRHMGATVTRGHGELSC